MTTKLFTFATASAIACALTISPAWANPEGGYGGHSGGYEKGQHGMGAAMMEMMMHGGAGQAAPHGKNPHSSNPHGANPHGEAKPQ